MQPDGIAMGRDSHTIRTSLSVDECKSRLKAALKDQRARASSLFPTPELLVPFKRIRRTVAVAKNASGSSPATEPVEAVVDGMISDSKLTLWVTRQVEGISIANSFAPRLYARLHECNGGSCLTVTFRMATVALVLLTIWMAGILAMGGLALFGVAAGWERHASVWVILGLPIVMLIAGYAFLRFFTWLATRDRSLMMDFIKRAVDGTQVPIQ